MTSASLLHSYAFWHIYEYGNDEERSHLRQMKIELRAWNAVVLKYSVNEVFAGQGARVYTAFSLSLHEGGHQDVQEMDAILEPYLTYAAFTCGSKGRLRGRQTNG